MHPDRRVRFAALALISLLIAASAHAAEIGHFNPGVAMIRDYQLGEPGFYAVSYQYFYKTSRFNDEDGDRVDSINVHPGPGPGVDIDVDVEVDLFAWAPAFVYVLPFEVIGAKYGVFALPSFANASLNASLDVLGRAGIERDAEEFAFGDLYFSPIWLTWSGKHTDFSATYGFYAPTGKYDVDKVTVPVLGTRVKIEEPDNIGFGFWTHQFQGSATYYPFENRATAFAATGTYEIHGDKDEYDLTPGHNFTLDYGISQYLPLSEDQHLLLEVGPAGYSSWQTTEDSGDDASDDRLDQVHAIGGQAGITYVPWLFVANFHAFHEFHSEDRFQGTVVGFSFAKKFW
jgi:hypothetical protein